MPQMFFVLAVSVARVATTPTVTASVCRSESTDGLHYTSFCSRGHDSPIVGPGLHVIEASQSQAR